MAGREIVVTPGEAGVRLDKWLSAPERLGSRGRAAKALGRGQVFLGGVEQSPSDGGRKLAAGDLVRLWLDRPGSADRRAPRRTTDLEVLFADGALLVAVKPAGLLTVPLHGGSGERSLLEAVARHWRSHGGREPLVVHRIDRDTSGLVLFARDGAAFHALKDQFARREPRREYLAVVRGVPEPRSGAWRDWLKWDDKAVRQRPVSRDDPEALEAVTRYEVVEAYPSASLLRCSLVSGRRHQIRVQASLHHHPVVGERQYVREDEPAWGPAFPRQALHAETLGFVHPVSGETLTFTAPPPPDFARLVASLRATKKE